MILVTGSIVARAETLDEIRVYEAVPVQPSAIETRFDASSSGADRNGE